MARRAVSLVALLLCIGGAGDFASAGEVERPELRDQLLAMADEDRSPTSEAAEKTDHADRRLKLRAILTESGWPARKQVGAEAEDAMLWLLEDEYTDLELLRLAQKALNEAVSKGLARKADLATIIDLTRTSEGRMQVYGTQYTLGPDGRATRFPLEDPKTVDARRALVGLSTLRYQEEAMGLLPANPKELFAGSAQGFVAGTPILKPAIGLNSISDVTIGSIYVHSRDDRRAHEGEHPAPPIGSK